MKRFLIFLGILFSSVFITSRVSAYEISQFCDYTEPCLTTEQISNWINDNSIDTTFYDNYIITVAYNSSISQYNFTIKFFNSEDILNNYVYYDSDKLIIKKEIAKWFEIYKYSSEKKMSLSDVNIIEFNHEVDQFTNFDSSIYYSTFDVKDSSNNVVLAKNDYDIVKNYNVNFHLNNGIAIDTYQSDIEKNEIINKVKSILGIDKIIQDYPKLSKTMNDLFVDPNENKFSKFCRDWIIDVETQYSALLWYQKLINKEYAQPIYYYEDFTINIKSNELEERLKKITITKENMSFKGLYYDDNYQNNVKENYIINSDVDLYAKYDYENVDDFLKDNTFKSYTFDENYAYAFISIGKNVGQDVYLGLDFLNYSIEIYKYDKTELKANKGSSFCLTPYFSKDNKYYYRLETINNDYYNVLVLPREKLITEENGIFTTHYNFLLTDNATVTYTNDLKQGEIVDDSGNKITIDIEDSYNYSQEAFLKDTDDLLTIFKNLLKNKDNNVFQYFEQVWQFLKRSKIFIYLNILIIGALIILIIKAANRR